MQAATQHTRIAAVPRARSTVLLAVSVAAVVGLQIAYPLVHGDARANVTVLIVTLFAFTCLAHAAVTRGPRAAIAVFLASAALGYAIEVVGVGTGFPFGTYSYGTALGPHVLDVPPVVGLAWTMLAWPAAAVARALVRSRTARVVVGAWALAAADLFLDPQLVASGAWTWRSPSPHLPGLPAIPLTNYAGWLLAALLVMTAVQWAAGADTSGRDDQLAVGLYIWLWVGWTLAQAVFLHLPASAAWGAVGMGSVAVPVLLRRRT